MAKVVAITNTKYGAKNVSKEFKADIRTKTKAEIESFSGLYRHPDNTWTRKPDYKRALEMASELIGEGELEAVFSHKDTYYKYGVSGAIYNWDTETTENVVRLPDNFARPVINKKTVYYPDFNDLKEPTDKEGILHNAVFNETLALCMSLIRRHGYENVPPVWFVDTHQFMMINEMAKHYCYMNDNSITVNNYNVRYLRSFAEEGITGEAFDEAARKGYFWHIVGFNVIVCPNKSRGEHLTHYIEKKPEDNEWTEMFEYEANEPSYIQEFFLEDKIREAIQFQLDEYGKLHFHDEEDGVIPQENIYLDVPYGHCEICGEPLTRRIFLRGRDIIEERRKIAEAEIRRSQKYYQYQDFMFRLREAEAEAAKLRAKAEAEAEKKALKERVAKKFSTKSDTVLIAYQKNEMAKPEKTQPSAALLKQLTKLNK